MLSSKHCSQADRPQVKQVSFPPLFIWFMGFSSKNNCGGLPFSPPGDHSLSELCTVICLSWVTLHGMAHSFIELRKPLHHDKAVIHEGVFRERLKANDKRVAEDEMIE